MGVTLYTYIYSSMTANVDHNLRSEYPDVINCVIIINIAPKNVEDCVVLTRNKYIIIKFLDFGDVC